MIVGLDNYARNIATYTCREMERMIEKYQRMGLTFIPIQYGQKKPPFQFQWDEYQDRKPTPHELVQWKARFWNQPSNIAIVCGKTSEGLIAIDFDERARYYIAKAHLMVNKGIDLVSSTPVVKTSRGFHVWIKISDPRIKNINFNHIEVRCDKLIVVAPPSFHEKGAKYEFLDPNIEDIVTIDSLSDLGIRSEMLSWATQDIPAWVDDVIEGVPEGKRNTTCFDLARCFRDMNLPMKVTLVILKEWAVKCTPSYDEKEAESCVKRTYEYVFEPNVAEDNQPTSIIFQPLDYVIKNAPPLVSLWANILFPSTTVLLSGKTGVGKTTFLYNMCINLARGEPFGGIGPIKPLKVRWTPSVGQAMGLTK